jgi:exoribonuclease R
VAPRLAEDGARLLTEGIEALHRELGVTPEFPPEVEAEAATAALAPLLPELDRTDLPLVTIDPEGSRDLDQAVHLERRGAGYRVFYAIADVAAFVRPGGAIDEEAHRRGETLYGVGAKVPLHPPQLSEGACSLLPDGPRPALLWTIDVDGSGERTAVRVERALVRSRAQLSYSEVQAALGAGTADPAFGLLREVGELRLAREQDRGGVSLPLPDQEVELVEGGLHLAFRSPLPVENWNAQISLLTGISAAALMLEGGVGVLRTLPPPDPRDVARLRRVAKALRVGWPDPVGYPEFIRGLDSARADHAAVLTASASLLRGSGYVSFTGSVPEHHEHAALATSYSHVTAPLRRLVDRYGGEVCLAICAGTAVPGWVTERLAGLPATMRSTGAKAGQYERGVLDLVEAVLLRDRVGESFAAMVVDVDERDLRRGQVMLRDPAVGARVEGPGPLPLGTDLPVRLVEADPLRRAVRFEPASADGMSGATRDRVERDGEPGTVREGRAPAESSGSPTST